MGGQIVRKLRKTSFLLALVLLISLTFSAYGPQAATMDEVIGSRLKGAIALMLGKS